MNPHNLGLYLQDLLEAARANPGTTQWRVLPTSPADRVQVGVKALASPHEIAGVGLADWAVFLRRPGGKEHVNELNILGQALGLDVVYFERRELGPPRSSVVGPKVYLVGLGRIKPK